MAGIEWQAIPIITAMYGIMDIEAFIARLMAIRDHQNKLAELERGH